MIFSKSFSDTDLYDYDVAEIVLLFFVSNIMSPLHRNLYRKISINVSNNRANIKFYEIMLMNYIEFLWAEVLHAYSFMKISMPYRWIIEDVFLYYFSTYSLFITL